VKKQLLTKPISLYPDAVSISPTDNKITLSATYPASCSLETFVGEDGVEYCYASLLIGDDNYNYRVYVGENGVETACLYPTIERKPDSIVLTYELDLNRTDLYGRCVEVVTSFIPNNGPDNGIKQDGNFIIKKVFPISKLSKNKIYRWKMRAFEKNSISKEDVYISNTNIGYGTISEVFISDNVTVNTECMLTIFPHTNIYDWVLGEPPLEYDSDDKNLTTVGGVTNENWYFGTGTYKSLSRHYPSGTLRKGYDNYIDDKTASSIAFNVLNSVRNIDKNIKYYLSINGKQYKILKYRFRPLSYWSANEQCYYVSSNSKDYYSEGWVDKTQTYLGWSNSTASSNGYAVAEEWRILEALNNAMSDSEGSLDSYGNPINGYVLIDSNDTFTEGSTYKICCNYIDSDEAYFEIHSEPKITLVETNGNCEMTDIDGNVLCTKSNPYSLSYCNINILGEFSQTEGVEHSYYSYKIYEKNNIGDYERIYHSSNIYNSDLRITYEDFLDGREYKIVLTIVDTNNRTFERELYFATNFTPVVNPIMARAEYYEDHNSVIVEWSPLNSISPVVKNDNFNFVDLSGGEEDDAVFIDDGNSVTYHQNDFNQPLSFSKPLFGIRFKATENTKKIVEVHSPDNIYTISMDSFYNVDVKNCDDVIVIDTATTRYVYSIKNVATTEESIEALSTGTSPINKTLVWDNNLTWDGTYTWVNGQNTNESEYEVIISSDENCVVRCITTGETLRKIDKFSYPTPIVKESKVILYGNVYFTDMTLVNNSDIYSIDNFVNTEWQWYSDTQLLVSFNGSFNGADGATIGNSKLIGYKVYKSIGNSVKLHKIAETASDETIIEDFIVGDNCSYKYYIYPLFQDQFNENLYYPNKPIETSEITLNHSVNKVVSLKKIGDETYCVNLDGVWRLMLNLEDNGYTIKNSKTFADSLNAYTQEYVGNMKYITKSVSGLIGMIDCYSGGDIVDTYDMLISWNDFVTSADLKCYVDSRGLILPGNFEAEPNVEYVKHPKSYAVVKFNWRQKSDLDIIKIYATIIPYNPIYEGVLYSDDSLGLMSIDNKLLIVNGR
jgi:hypothetical protein